MPQLKLKSESLSKKIIELIAKGVVIHAPYSIDISDDVNIENIASNNVIIHAGCHLRGKNLSIASGCVIGSEAPVTLDDCQLSKNVSLAGGYFSGSVFLDNVSVSSCAHIRDGCLLEEWVKIAHSVGLKNSIFFPFVTAGSLINFCDILISGGDSRKNHSEIGSSYVHFNFTTHGDKATASLVGDVPRGVFLNQKPIFLGGQGGMIGPRRVEYGSVCPAGVILREDILEEQMIYWPKNSNNYQNKASKKYIIGAYSAIKRTIENNFFYLGNLCALKSWYKNVRSLIMRKDYYSNLCLIGALRVIDENWHERIKRLDQLAEKLINSVNIWENNKIKSELKDRELKDQKEFVKDWGYLKDKLLNFKEDEIAVKEREEFMLAFNRGEYDYIEAIRKINNNPNKLENNVIWLKKIVDNVVGIYNA